MTQPRPEIDESVAKAEEAEGNQRWGDGARYYTEAIRLLDRKHGVEQPTDRGAKLAEEEKTAALERWIGYLHCKIEMMRADTETLFYDMGKELGKEIKKVEKEIDRYRIRNRVYLWNTLLRTYDRWGEDRRNAGMKYEADELQYYMLKARMRRERWRIHWQKSPLPSPVSAVSDFLRAWIEWMLYRIGKGLFWPFLLFMICPIVLFALLYHWSGGIRLEGNNLESPDHLPSGLQGFWYCLYFSVFVFTGSEPGALTTCGDPAITGLMALEAMLAYIFMVVVIGYLVNRLSSR